MCQVYGMQMTCDVCKGRGYIVKKEWTGYTPARRHSTVCDQSRHKNPEDKNIMTHEARETKERHGSGARAVVANPDRES
jgi:RecJ-like exonuclease